MTDETKSELAKERVITLSNAPPARIHDDEWPVIAFDKWRDSALDYQARKGWMYIRKHADGRMIVYAGLDTPWAGETRQRAGELVPAGSPDLVDAIMRVARAVGAHDDFAQGMIARLPPVEI